MTNQSYHHVQIHGPCIWLALRMGFFFFWSSIVIGLCVLKLEAILLEVFPKNLLWSNILLLLPLLSLNRTIVRFHCFSQMEIILLRSFCCNNSWVCKINRSVIRVATYQIHVVHGCFKDWYIFYFFILWFLLNLVVNFVGKHWIEKLRDQVLLRLIFKNDLD